MKINLGNGFEFECFQIEQAINVERLAKDTAGVVYSWKTEGRHNWLQQGFTVVDTLGLTVLSEGLPELIE